MAENSKIEWTDATFNPWRGCTKVSAGCAHCYADTQSKRNPAALGVWGPSGTRVVLAEAGWRDPVKWNRLAAEGRLPDGSPNPDGHRPRVFCASLADVFEEWTGPMFDSHETELCACHGCGEWMYFTQHECKAGCQSDRLPRHLTMNDVRKRLFGLIYATPNLDWLLVTKRPENAARMMGPEGVGLYAHANGPVPCPQPNVWLGASVENQAAADERIPHLLRTPAAVRFLSCEPLLSAVDLRPYMTPLHDDGEDMPPGERRGWGLPSTRSAVDWVIVGGESGPGARPMHPEWARSLRDQCQAAGVPFFFKQFGEWAPEGDPHINEHRLINVAGQFQAMDKLPRGIGRHVPTGWSTLYRVGKKAAGRLLDGREWNEFPVPAEAAP